MKSFFVIKGSPNKWFDQQGDPVKSILTTYENEGFPEITTPAENAVSAYASIDNKDQIPILYLGYSVSVCGDIEEVRYKAEQQNNI